MRRRTKLVGTALAVGLLAIGVAVAPAAKPKSKPKPTKPVVVSLVCTTSVTTQVPAGQTQIVAPVSEGTDYGAVKCPGSLLGSGVHMDTFRVPDSGDTVGQYTEYFNTGTIHGSFDWTPQEGPPPTSQTVQAASYTGTLTVAGGTGAYAGILGTGTSVCGTPDGIHTNCTVKLKLTPKLVKAAKKK